MENNKMLILGGGSAVCLMLGYLGLNYMGGENISNLENKKEEEKNEESSVDLKEEIKKEVKEEVKLEIEDKKLYNSIEKETPTTWNNFWKNEYQKKTE